VKTNTILGIGAGVLATSIAAQGLLFSQMETYTEVHASWKYQPTNIQAATNRAKQVLKGRVVNIARAAPICVPAKGEPGGKDCIPTTVVTFAVEGAYKGGKPKTVQIYQTGMSSPSERGHKPEPRPKNNMHAGKPIAKSPPKIARGDLRGSSFMLDDDRAYKMNAEYNIHLDNGPTIKLANGQSVQTMTPLHPALKMEIRGGKLFPTSTKVALGQQMMGKPVTELTRHLPKFQKLNFSQMDPRLQKLIKAPPQQIQPQLNAPRLKMQQMPQQQMQR